MRAPKSFEEGMARLEEILAIIADESTPLADAVKKYTEAASLLAYCNESLANATVQIEEVHVKIAAQSAQSALLGAEDDIL